MLRRIVMEDPPTFSTFCPAGETICTLSRVRCESCELVMLIGWVPGPATISELRSSVTGEWADMY